MIQLNAVTDTPRIFGMPRLLLDDADLYLPRGRYALLSRTPELHRALIDVLTGLRPPRRGMVHHTGQVSWPIGRQGFIRGRATGLRMIEFVCRIYGMETGPGVEFVADLLTDPDYLFRSMEHWPLFVRQEFSFALGLLPAFDIYVIEGAIPFEPCRFTRLWLGLFEERLVGRTLILSTYRQNQMTDYCIKGLVYERNGFRVDADLDRCIRRFPARQSRSESADQGGEGIIEDYAGGQFGV
ncbi:ATPase [Bordetella genomosp. 10]|uniref:ATPase n=1 Tax=Bordetella genomosp. 10 TaxID=1416804 RepID=A0A261SD82_9BORD|nr:ATPase [Bordetella genomosp. 10]OZI34760.1 ATPase [Bordetella genomosp. 10]